MVLSHDLISQFVQATKDEPTEVKESVVYGTVQEDTHYVKLDGSDILTPVSTTTVVGAGDRVTVMIKNHTATITGNVSNPAARQIDTLSVDKLDAIYGEIDTLKAADVTVQNKLTANSADIETLKADDVTIKNTLSVHDADIETLTADNVTINEKISANEAAIKNLVSETATIESLDALKADVNLLTADVANIDTLMFGSASGDVIQTSFANAVIEQVGNAQIKSAMIESVSAGKITSGDIITNNVRVMSEDGSLIISDETLQISDGARVRVQIGKDAANDYSINIWDQSGNLMFSKGGITDAAIKEAIIRNDMVSDTANIHASKLDIDSLFEEINGSSNTIKSTKVYLDEEGQTLDVAFKSLTTEVTEQGETISSQGTAISTIQGQISSKIWQQDINTAKNEMSTQYSTLEQEVDSFQTTVSETYATKTSLTDVYNKTVHKSGTIDLTSDEYDADTYYPVVGNTIPYDGYRHVAVNVQLNSGSKPSWSTHDGGFTCNISVRMKAGGWGTVDANTLGWIDDFTYNFCDKMPAYIQQNRNASKPVLYLRGGGRYFVFTDYDATWTIYTEDYTQSNYTFSPTTNPSNSTGLVDNWKTLSRLSTAESSITQLSNKIATNVTETTNLGTRMTTIEQTADSLSIQLSNIEIGGENLLVGSKEIVNVKYGSSSVSDFNDNFKAAKCTGTWSGIVHLADDIISNSSAGDEFTFSVNMKTTATACLQFFAMCYDGSNTRVYPELSTGQFNSKIIVNSPDHEDDKRYSITFSMAQGWIDLINSGGYIKWTLQIASGASSDTPVYLYAPKLERGNKATDWSPNHVDLYDSMDKASQTATNYLNFSSSGLVIGDLTSSTLGKNVLIDSDSVDIRNGDTTLASFGADYLYLAKNSKTATIDLCNGLAKLYHSMDGSYSQFVIDTTNYSLSSTKILSTRYIPLTIETDAANTDNVIVKNIINGVTVGGFGMNTDGYMVRYGSELAGNVVPADPPIILDTENFATMMDSDWVNCTLNTETFTRYSNNVPQPQVRKIGKQVYLRGEAKPSTSVTPENDTDTYIATIPSGYRPSQRQQFVMQGSSSYRWLMSVHPDGKISISRYSNSTTANMPISAGAWLCCHAQWLID